jgi:hypothetical protein
MSKTLEVLKKLGLKRTLSGADNVSPFDHRLQKLGRVQPTHVARAVLFRTRQTPQEA